MECDAQLAPGGLGMMVAFYNAEWTPRPGTPSAQPGVTSLRSEDCEWKRTEATEAGYVRTLEIKPDGLYFDGEHVSPLPDHYWGTGFEIAGKTYWYMEVT